MNETGRRTPRPWTDDAYPYALDALDRQQRHAVDEWLVTTGPERVADFQTAVRRVQETMAELTVFDSVPPPAHLEYALLRALDEHDSRTPSLAHRDSLGKRWQMRWWTAAAAAVVAAGAGVGIEVVMDGVGEGSRVTAQQVLDRPDSSQSVVAVTGGGAMTVSLSKDLGAAAVTFSDLPAPARGSTYQVWLTPLGGTAKSVAVIDGAASVVTAVGPADVLAVTIEPAGGSPGPTTPPIARMTVD
ncbi:MAG: anti-sigma factor [Nocardia sp.]|nr:anti-sigma factor [Nocardia sp.]